MERLKNVADLLPAISGHFAFAKMGNFLAIQTNGSGRRPIESGDQAQQSRFAAAGWPDDRRHLALGNLKRHIIENR